jgi:chromate transporter
MTNHSSKSSAPPPREKKPAVTDNAPAGMIPQETLSLRRLFFSFLLLGSTAFGGPAILRHMKEFTVKDRRWLHEAEFREGIALCQSLPGATGMQMAAYIGRRYRGISGALAAYAGFGLPAITLMLLLSVLYERYHDIHLIIPLFRGLQIVVVAIIVHAAYMFGRDTLKIPVDIGIAIFSALLFGFAIHPLVIILAASMAGLILVKKSSAPIPCHHGTQTWQKTGRQIVILALLTLAAYVLLFLADRKLFDLAAVMLRVDLFAFGGGFGSLPIMFREVVAVKGWLDSKTFMDGIALGQITPGPIVVTATFAGYLLQGLAGAAIATIAIFTPSFLLLIAAAPFFDRFKASPYFAVITQSIYASFVGLLGFIAVKFGMAVHWDMIKVLFALAVFIALLKRLPLPGIVLAGALISSFLFR